MYNWVDLSYSAESCLCRKQQLACWRTCEPRNYRLTVSLHVFTHTGEVELMFQFSNHPNIVRAFYAITYTQNTLPSCGMGTSSSSSTAPARDAPNYMLNSSAGSSSNNRGGFASGGSGQRAALARLRSIPLQEIVVHEDGPCVHDTDQLPAAAAGKGTTAAAAAQQDDASYDSHDQSGITEASQARQLDAVDTANSSQQRQQQQQRPASNKPNNNATPGQSGALGSNLAVRGPPLGSKLESLNHSPYNRPSTDKVYSWMGGSSSGIGQQQQQGMYPSLVSSGPFPGTMGGVGWKKPGELVEPCKDMRAETWLVQVKGVNHLRMMCMGGIDARQGTLILYEAAWCLQRSLPVLGSYHATTAVCPSACHIL